MSNNLFNNLNVLLADDLPKDTARTLIKDFLKKLDLLSKFTEKKITIDKIIEFLDEYSSLLSNNNIKPIELYDLLFGWEIDGQRKDLNFLIENLTPGQGLIRTSKEELDDILENNIKNSIYKGNRKSGINISVLQSSLPPNINKLKKILENNEEEAEKDFSQSQTAFRNSLEVIEKKDKKTYDTKFKGTSIVGKQIDIENKEFIDSYRTVQEESSDVISSLKIDLKKYVKNSFLNREFVNIVDGKFNINSIRDRNIKNISIILKKFHELLMDNGEQFIILEKGFKFYFNPPINLFGNSRKLDDIRGKNYRNTLEMLNYFVQNGQSFTDEKRSKELLIHVRDFCRYAIYNGPAGSIYEDERTDQDPFSMNNIRSGESYLNICIGSFMTIRYRLDAEEREAIQDKLTNICKQVYGTNPKFIYNYIKSWFNKTNRRRIGRAIRRKIPEILVRNRFVNELKKMMALPPTF